MFEKNSLKLKIKIIIIVVNPIKLDLIHLPKYTSVTSADRLLNNLLSSHLFEITCSVALSFLKTISCSACVAAIFPNCNLNNS